VQNLEGIDSPSTLYFVTPEIHAAALDFFIPRRTRAVITGSNPALLDLTRSESEIVEQIGSLLKARDSQQPSSSADLSQREIEVLRLVAMGLINKEIADRLNISINTVLSHRKNITAKLGIRSVSGLSVYAMMNGYVNEADLNM
jgi:DNA-binding CsgD family transcriptional regulator